MSFKVNMSRAEAMVCSKGAHYHLVFHGKEYV